VGKGVEGLEAMEKMSQEANAIALMEGLPL